MQGNKLDINEEDVIKIQANYRGFKARKQYARMKQVAAGYEGGDYGDNEGVGQFIQIDE